MAGNSAGDHFAALELVKKALHQAADENLSWARENLRRTMSEAGRDLNQVSALTGLSVGTIRGFLRPKNPTDSTVGHVLLMALGLGIGPRDLFLPPPSLVHEGSTSAYQDLAARNPNSVVSVRDVNGNAIFVSPTSRLIGYEPEELMQLGPDETLQLVHPENQAKVASVLSEALAHEGKRLKVSYLLKNGDGTWTPRDATFWVERGDNAALVLVQIDSTASSPAEGGSRVNG